MNFEVNPFQSDESYHTHAYLYNKYGIVHFVFKVVARQNFYKMYFLSDKIVHHTTPSLVVAPNKWGRKKYSCICVFQWVFVNYMDIIHKVLDYY